jgi:hypothetical protein
MSQAKLVSWFGENGDPLLPENLGVEVKPFLRAFDDYQTYDAICWQSINRQLPFDKIFFNDLGNPFLIAEGANELKAILVERFTPWYDAWADQYSDYLKEIIDHFLSLGEKWKFPPVDFAQSVPYSIQISEDEPEADTAVITWLYQDTQELNKQRITVNSYAETPFNWQFNIRDFHPVCPYSIVVSGGNGYLKGLIEREINNQASYLLYASISDFIQFVTNNFNRRTANNPDVKDPFRRDELFVFDFVAEGSSSFEFEDVFSYPTEDSKKVIYDNEYHSDSSRVYPVENTVATAALVSTELMRFIPDLESHLAEWRIPSSELDIRLFDSFHGRCGFLPVSNEASLKLDAFTGERIFDDNGLSGRISNRARISRDYFGLV